MKLQTALLVLLLSFVATPNAELFAKEKDQRVVGNWNAELNQIDRLISDGESKKALKKADRLVRSMIDLISAGSDSKNLVGSAYLLRAVAAYENGDADLALWYWQIGTQIAPDVLSRLDMNRYGEAGEYLTTHGALRHEDFPNGSQGLARGNPPQRKSGGPPEIPQARKQELQNPLAVTVSLIVTKDGRASQPMILAADAEFTVLAAALESLRDWRFKPGVIDGEAVDMQYFTTINFRHVSRF